MNYDRKLASFRTIIDLQPIPNADRIEVATVDGWKVVVEKGRFSVGETVVYIEIDSWVPHTLAPFLSKGKTPREFNSVPGERLRTVKLRGQISQGLILSIKDAMPTVCDFFTPDFNADLTTVLGVQKYEKPLPPELAGVALANFPIFLPKTDQPRLQNIGKELSLRNPCEWYEVSEKMDGSSMTVYYRVSPEGEEEYGVCSRNIDLVEDDNNIFWKTAKQRFLIEKLRQIGRNLAFQGELVGPGIQGNPYDFQSTYFFLFDIWDIDHQQYLSPTARWEIAQTYQILHVPLISWEHMLTDHVLEDAQGWATHNLNIEREGLVYKSHSDPSFSFKVINNQWLLTEK